MSQFSTVLIKSVRAYAGQLTSLARGYAPKHLKTSISSSVTEQGEGDFRITIKAVAPDAKAWEYGSGIHAQKGTKGKYLIKGNPLLVFPWQVATQNPEQFNMTKDGRVILPEVHHPGIQAANNGKGYIRPAVKDFRKAIKSKELRTELKQAILGDIRKSLEGSNG